MNISLYTNHKNSKGFVPVIVLLVVGILASAGFVVYTQNTSGQQGTQNVLGKEDKTESEDEADDDSEDDESSDDSVSGTQKPESTQKPSETKKPELRKLASPKPAKTPEIDDEEFEDEDSEDSTEKTEFEVDSEEGKVKIKIKSKNGQFEFEQEDSQLKVQSQMQISVDSATNNLTVTTPEGEKDVNILPQAALDNIVSLGMLSIPSNIELQSEDRGGVSYKIEGSDSKKFLGLFSVSIPKTVTVSANSGLVVGIEQDFASKLLNFFSTQ